MRTGLIYIIKNTINEKVYIGQTIMTVEERWNTHIRRSRQKEYKYKLYNAIRKYDVGNFYYEILEDNIAISKIDEKEIYYIKLFNSYQKGYNSTPGGDGRIFSELDENKVIELYKSGLSSMKLGGMMNVSWRTIIRILERNNIETRDNSKDIDDNSLAEDYLNGMSLKEMSEKYDINIKTINRHINKMKLPKRINNQRKEPLEPIDQTEFIVDYNNEMKLEDMAKKHNVCVKTIGKIRNKLNLPKRR